MTAQQKEALLISYTKLYEVERKFIADGNTRMAEDYQQRRFGFDCAFRALGYIVVAVFNEHVGSCPSCRVEGTHSLSLAMMTDNQFESYVKSARN